MARPWLFSSSVFGDKAHNGPKSFFGLMDAQKMKVFPTNGSKERAGFTGGYIVQTYGGNKGHGIDAIQLEFGGDYRTKDNQKKRPPSWRRWWMSLQNYT